MKLLRRTAKWAGLAALTFLIAIMGMNWWVVRASRGRVYTDVRNVPAQRVALLLGTAKRVRSGAPNAFFTYRIQAAIELYRSGKIQKIIVSGDNGQVAYNETEDMRASLEAAGIPATAIVNDHAGFRTLDSVLRAESVFGQTEFVVISQEFHVRRAIFIARAHDLDAIGYVARDPANTAASRKVYLREVGARVKAWLDCYLLGTRPKFDGPSEPISFSN